jgi:hypothetical protein
LAVALKTDKLTRGGSSSRRNDLAIWYMNGTTITSGIGLGTIATTYTIQGTNAD